MRLLEGREVTTLGHFVPVLDIWHASFPPLSNRGDDLLGEPGHACPDCHLEWLAALGTKTLPIETLRCGVGCRRPIGHDVVEQFIASEDVLEVAVPIGPGP